jgi:hypothetical protein
MPLQRQRRGGLGAYQFRSRQAAMFASQKRARLIRPVNEDSIHEMLMTILDPFSARRADDKRSGAGVIASSWPIWPIYGALDLTREGRGDSAAYPNLQY